MIRDLIKEILENQIFDELLMEGPEEVQKIKDQFYPDLRIKPEVIAKIYDELKNQQVLKKNYINWIFLLIKNRVPRVVEDLETIAKNLKVFNAKSAQISQDGIPTMLYKQNGELVYKKQQDLYDITAKYGDVDPAYEKNLLKKGEYLESKGLATKIYEDNNYIVYRPDTYEASQVLGCLSQWCTRFPNMYETYSKDGPLYIIFDKRKLGTEDIYRMIQFHIPSRQFKDVNDREVPKRREFMNNLKGLFNTLFPSAIKEFQLVQDGKRNKEDLTGSARNSKFIMPSEYWDQLDIPCDEIQEKIASELGVECSDVEEVDYGYEVDGAIYRVETVESAIENSIDMVISSGLDDKWFIDNIISKKDWTDVFPENEIDIPKTIEDEFGDDWKDLYYEYFEDYLNEIGEQYTDEEIENGNYTKDISYNAFLDAIEARYGEDPLKWFVEEMGMGVKDLNFIDLGKEVEKYLRGSHYGYDPLEQWVASYDGTAYYFTLNGVDQVMYRTD